MSTQTFTNVIAALRKVEHVTVGSQIKLALSGGHVVGINVHASSAIRKQNFTKSFMELWCKEHGFTLMDKYPTTAAMQIIF